VYQFDEWSAYVRFIVTLAGGLTAFCVLVSGVIDQFFTEHSWRDYRRASKPAVLSGTEAELDVEDISVLDLASQLSSGRLSRKREDELHKLISSRSYRSYLKT
jgi:hypothetical protein